MSPCTVASVRAELCPALSARYKDYRIERWIAQKKGNQAEVVKAIMAQRGNDDRLELIMTDPKRRKETLEELSRKVLSIIHNSSTHEMILYINTRNQAPQFDEQREGDALLVTMHYLLHRMDELEGECQQAVCIIDKTEVESPKLSDIEGKVRMFGSIMFRSFPGTFTNTYLCCTWGSISRKAVSSLARGFGLQAEFVTPGELMGRLGKAYTPTVIGGDYYLDAARSMDVLVAQFMHSAAAKKMVAAPAATAPCASGCKWSAVMSQSLRVPPKTAVSQSVTPLAAMNQTVLGAAALFCLVAGLLGQYMAVMLALGGVAYVMKLGQASQDQNIQPLGCIVRLFLDSHYSECMATLLSASSAANVQDLNTDNKEEMQVLALTVTASLRVHQKDRLKRCFQLVSQATAIMTRTEDDLELSLTKWQRLFQYMQAMGSLQVLCPCGCNGSGDLDWLDAHFDGAPASRTAVIAQLGRRRSTTFFRGPPPPTREDPSPPGQGHTSSSPQGASSDVASVGTPRSPLEVLSPSAHPERHLWMKDWKEQWGQRRGEWKEEWEQRRTELTNKYRRDKDASTGAHLGRTTPLAGFRFRVSRDEGAAETTDSSKEAVAKHRDQEPGPRRRNRATRHLSPFR